MAKINPNRMELLRLKKREKTATRGHKLLKDKLDALMRRFLQLIDDARTRREAVERELAQAFGLLALARGEAGTLVIADALTGAAGDTVVDVEIENLMSVRVPRYSLPELAPEVTYSLATTPALLDIAVSGFSEMLRTLVSLAELEKTIQLLALEIERTRRRVNALEHILIPGLGADIKQINMSLAELERANLIRVMKIKEIVSAKG